MTQHIKTRVRAQQMMRAKKIGTTIVITLFIVLFSFCSYIEHTYTKEATAWVYDNGTVGFIDDTGHEYIAVNVKNVAHQQRVKLIMNDECTASNTKDDSIRRIKPIDIVLD